TSRLRSEMARSKSSESNLALGSILNSIALKRPLSRSKAMPISIDCSPLRLASSNMIVRKALFAVSDTIHAQMDSSVRSNQASKVRETRPTQKNFANGVNSAVEGIWWKNEGWPGLTGKEGVKDVSKGWASRRAHTPSRHARHISGQ